jgi:hypothetical protein
MNAVIIESGGREYEALGANLLWTTVASCVCLVHCRVRPRFVRVVDRPHLYTPIRLTT